MYNYEEFIEELRKALLISTKYDDSQIYFKRKGEIPAATDDKLFIDFKINGTFRESCALFAKKLYSQYQNGISIDTMKNGITAQLKELERSMCFDIVQNLSSYRRSKEYLFIRPVNINRNEKILKNAVYRTLGDIAFVLYIRLSNEDGKITSMKVAQEFVKNWNMDKDKIFENALQNTLYLSPPRIYRLNEIYSKADYNGDDFMASTFSLKEEDYPFGYCISTVPMCNGAIALFLPDIARRFGELLGESYFIEFPSIHEALVTKESKAKLSDMKERLQRTADNMDNKDFLSKLVYYYSIETGTFSVIQN